MTKIKRLTLLAGLIGLWFLIMACFIASGGPNYSGEGAADGIITPLSGQGPGTAESIWKGLQGEDIVCPDPAANYTVTIAVDSKLPSDTRLSSPIPKKLHYFRIDAVAVLRILQDGQCLQRDASTDRVHTVIEGTVDGTTYRFTTLSCDIYGKPSSADIHFTTGLILNADISCKVSDQYRITFSFSDLPVK